MFKFFIVNVASMPWVAEVCQCILVAILVAGAKTTVGKISYRIVIHCYFIVYNRKGNDTLLHRRGSWEGHQCVIVDGNACSTVESMFLSV
jgi:hypothetical protein